MIRGCTKTSSLYFLPLQTPQSHTIITLCLYPPPPHLAHDNLCRMKKSSKILENWSFRFNFLCMIKIIIFWSTPPPPHYHFLSLSLCHVLTYFYVFFLILCTFYLKFWLLGDHPSSLEAASILIEKGDYLYY